MLLLGGIDPSKTPFHLHCGGGGDVNVYCLRLSVQPFQKGSMLKTASSPHCRSHTLVVHFVFMIQTENRTQYLFLQQQ